MKNTIIRLFVSFSFLLVFTVSDCFVAWATLPPICRDADKQINVNTKIRLYTQCLQSGGLSGYDFSSIYTKRGVLYEKLGENTLALRDYSRAIQNNSKYYDAFYNRGNVHSRLGEYEAAIQDLEKAIQLRPKKVAAYNNLAWLLITSEDPQYKDEQRALDLILRTRQFSISGDIDHPIVLDTLAAVYAELGQFDQAIESQSKAITISEEKGSGDLSNKLREALSEYKQNRKYY